MTFKPSILALASLVLAAGAAQAQSNVTLFGVVDVGVRQVDNAGTKQSQLSTDGIQSSRLGFRGTEDLGGGLKAGFWLESALNADTGAFLAPPCHREPDLRRPGRSAPGP
jgi:predicted porin